MKIQLNGGPEWVYDGSDTEAWNIIAQYGPQTTVLKIDPVHNTTSVVPLLNGTSFLPQQGNHIYNIVTVAPTDQIPDPTEPEEPLAAFVEDKDHKDHVLQQILTKEYLSSDYWTKIINSKLHISESLEDCPIVSSFPLFDCDDDWTDELRDRLTQEGIFTIDSEWLSWGADSRLIANCICLLLQHGWHPVFVWLFDEMWLLVNQLSNFIEKAFGHHLIYDFFGWYINPETAGQGFAPHRDRPSATGSFSSTGIPKYISYWIPFTNATTENSCLYCVPAHKDPEYMGKKDDSGHEQSPERSEIITDPRHIRAFPVSRGSIVGFSHRLLHWGSASSRFGKEPRVSTFIASSGDEQFEGVYLKDKTQLPLPPFDVRLGLVFGHRLWYSRDAPVPAPIADHMLKTFEERAHYFQQSYVDKVFDSDVVKLVLRKRKAEGNLP
eukprot:TRINITY_DN112371_c0_g1_i1.p1 TRINITY_DN112371_c0_g1~~TRINITY_DN112371_c0_g1_i1.p1  ORF type:complete len:437 (+),score=35.64 TRINITY_DN112371_c0_g1_i1:15-1325(+)